MYKIHFVEIYLVFYLWSVSAAIWLIRACSLAPDNYRHIFFRNSMLIASRSITRLRWICTILISAREVLWMFGVHMPKLWKRKIFPENSFEGSTTPRGETSLRAFGHLGWLWVEKVKCPLGIWAFRQNSGITKWGIFWWAIRHLVKNKATNRNAHRAFGHLGIFIEPL